MAKTLPAGVALALALVATPLPTRAALLARWHFDEAGGAIAFDSTGSFPGVLSATGAAFVAGGVSGNAISLDRATNGTVNMGNVLGLEAGDFSIVAWVRTTATEIDVAVLSKHESFSENGYFLAINQTGNGGQPEKATFVASEFVAQGVTSTTTVNDGAWHQVVGVYHAGGLEEIYVDGASPEDSDVSEPIVPNAAPFLIGGANKNGVADARYTGLVDEVQVYDQSLTSEQVEFLFANPALTVPEPAGLALAALGSLAALGLVSARTRRS